jgi:hypothetical protein
MPSQKKTANNTQSPNFLKEYEQHIDNMRLKEKKTKNTKTRDQFNNDDNDDNLEIKLYFELY